MARGRVFTPFEKGQIWALHKDAHWPLQRIADRLETSKQAISSIITRIERDSHTPPRRGRPPVITTRKRRRLIQRATTDDSHRRLRLDQLSHMQLEGVMQTSADITVSGIRGLQGPTSVTAAVGEQDRAQPSFGPLLDVEHCCFASPQRQSERRRLFWMAKDLKCVMQQSFGRHRRVIPACAASLVLQSKKTLRHGRQHSVVV